MIGPANRSKCGVSDLSLQEPYCNEIAEALCPSLSIFLQLLLNQDIDNVAISSSDAEQLSRYRRLLEL